MLKRLGYFRNFLLSLDETFGTSTVSEHGFALKPTLAIECLFRDKKRTRELITGLFDAVHDRMLVQDGPVRIMEAGSGPLAPATLIVASQFQPEDVQFGLVDCHRLSVYCAQHLVRQLGLTRHCFGVKRADLITADFKDWDPNIVLTEVMNAALALEPQLDIEANLISQTKPDTWFLPRSITIRAKTLGEGGSVDIGEIFRWDDEMRSTLRLHPERKEELLRIRRRFEEGLPYTPRDIVVYNSSIEVYGGAELRPGSSMLNSLISCEPGVPEANVPFEIDYRAGAKAPWIKVLS